LGGRVAISPTQRPRRRHIVIAGHASCSVAGSILYRDRAVRAARARDSDRNRVVRVGFTVVVVRGRELQIARRSRDWLHGGLRVIEEGCLICSRASLPVGAEERHRCSGIGRIGAGADGSQRPGSRVGERGGTVVSAKELPLVGSRVVGSLDAQIVGQGRRCSAESDNGHFCSLETVGKFDQADGVESPSSHHNRIAVTTCVRRVRSARKHIGHAVRCS